MYYTQREGSGTDPRAKSDIYVPFGPISDDEELEGELVDDDYIEPDDGPFGSADSDYDAIAWTPSYPDGISMARSYG